MVRSLLVAAALLAPVAAAAEAPPPVTAVHAERVPEGVRVSWKAVPGPIARYQVYYSSESILQNGGAYEDFDLTEGAVTSYVLTGPFTKDAVTVAVIAEGFTGEDSGFFVEEASVPAETRGPALVDDAASSAPSSSAPRMVTEEPTGADIPVVTDEEPEQVLSSTASSVMMRSEPRSSSSSSTPVMESSEAQPPQEEPVMEEPAAPVQEAEDPVITALRESFQSPFRLHAIYAPSAKQVRMFFSHNVIVDASAGGTVLIQDAAGRSVAVKQLLVNGSMLTAELSTSLKAGARYALIVGPGVQGQDFGDPDLHFDINPLVRAAYFLAPSGSPGTNDVPRVVLNATPDGDDTYMVEAAWEFPAKQSQVSGFTLVQSTDEGVTENGEHTVPFGVNAVVYHKVAEGAFSLRIRTLALDGTPSQGVRATVTLLPLHSDEPTLPKRLPTPSAPLTGSVTAPSTPNVPPSSGLSHSGAAVGLALIASGAAAGIARMRRKKVAAIA